MKREKLICDKRSGCVGIYKKSNEDDTNDCHSSDKRNMAYSQKDCKFNGSFLDMDEETLTIYEDMVNAYNEKYSL